jgi:LysM repeat protein
MSISLEERMMVNLSLKQHVHARRGRSPVTRFRLLVGGRTKRVWDKVASRAVRPVPRAEVRLGTRLAGCLRHLFRVRWLAATILSLAGLGLAAVFILCFSSAAFDPPPLPVERGVLASPLAEPVEDENSADSPPAGNLALKKLTLATYSVQGRDTLEGIARKFNLDIDTLISFNGVSDVRGVGRGMALTIPSHRGLRYRVRNGDSLLKLSRKFGVSLDDLLDWNNLSRSMITVGQALFIPGGRLSAGELGRVMGTLFIRPTVGKLSSNYGIRVSPITGTRMHHNGLDLSNQLMTRVNAAAAGRVGIVDYNPTYGNFIIIIHGNGFQTLYGHLEAIYVKKGQSVTQGERIGAMGSTGASTGSHLHFAIFKNGRDVDPLKYLR